MDLLTELPRDALAAFARRNPGAHAYELGDLDDAHVEHTRWYGLGAPQALSQLALLHTGFEPAVLIAIAEPPVEAMHALLARIAPRLPSRVYAHLTPGLQPALAARYAIEPRGRHLKMLLAHDDALARYDRDDVVALSTDARAELEALYAAAYPGSWFDPRTLASGRYVGVREGGRLVAVAGVHVASVAMGAAALGNVATHPDVRGRGLATAACARLCRGLRDDGIATVALNVHADNAAAIACYRKLGFEVCSPYDEAMLTARDA